jgi:predicted RNase H-like nuclease
MEHVSNEQMAKKIAEESKQYFYHDEYECGLACAKRMAKLKDKQHKDIEEGLRETINALDAKLQKANESGMYYFDQCNIQKQKLIDKACKWLERNDSYAVPTNLQVDRLREYLNNIK